MKRPSIIITLCLLPFALSLVSCSEKEDEGEYYNWQQRNQQFIDSIAKVAADNADGSWEIIRSYTLGDNDQTYLGQTNYHIYVKKLEQGTASEGGGHHGGHQ